MLLPPPLEREAGVVERVEQARLARDGRDALCDRPADGVVDLCDARDSGWGRRRVREERGEDVRVL